MELRLIEPQRRRNVVAWAVLTVLVLAMGIGTAIAFAAGADPANAKEKAKVTRPEPKPTTPEPKKTQPKKAQPKKDQPKKAQPKKPQPEARQPETKQPENTQPTKKADPVQPTPVVRKPTKTTPDIGKTKPPRPGRTIRGRLLDDRNRPVQQSAYWVEWHRRDVGGTAHLGAGGAPSHAQRTDRFGRFTVPLEAHYGLLWFEAPGGLRCVCRVTPTTLAERTWSNVRLPRMDTVTIRARGKVNGKRYRLFAYPSDRSNTGWSRSDGAEWPARFWRRNPSQVDRVFTHTFLSRSLSGPSAKVLLPAFRTYELEIRGEEFAATLVGRRPLITKAPATVVFDTGKVQSARMLLVRDADGKPTTFAGRVLVLEGHGPGRRHARLDAGRWSLGYGMLAAEGKAHIGVLMADGEFFEKRFRIGATDLISFVRGEGQACKRLPVRDGALPPRSQVVVSRGTGTPLLGVPCTSATRLDGARFAYLIEDKALGLVRLPGETDRVYALAPDGRVWSGYANLTPMAGTDLAPIDLAAAYRRHGDDKAARATFALELHTSNGRRRWIVLDSMAIPRGTTRLPKWRKFVPQGWRVRASLTVPGRTPVDITPGGGGG